MKTPMTMEGAEALREELQQQAGGTAARGEGHRRSGSTAI